MAALARNLIKHAGNPKNFGFCPICEKLTVFIKTAEWLRDNYICARCRSIPRQRALIKVFADRYRNYRSMAIHESSPSGPASAKLRRECPKYVPTHFYSDLTPGVYRQGFRCENLEDMTFDDESFDIIITQDVMEHVMNPAKAFKEIARTLKPGGAHVFTVPLYPKKTVVRAVEENGSICYLEEKVFHGNPIDQKGSLVVTDWGDDLVEVIKESSGLDTEIVSLMNRKFGLEAKFLEVLVSSKPER